MRRSFVPSRQRPALLDHPRWAVAIVGALLMVCAAILVVVPTPSTAAAPARPQAPTAGPAARSMTAVAPRTEPARPPVRCGDEPKHAAPGARRLPQRTIRVRPGMTLCGWAHDLREQGYKVSGDRPVTAQYVWSVNRGRRVLGDVRFTDPDLIPARAKLRLRAPAARQPQPGPGEHTRQPPTPSTTPAPPASTSSSSSAPHPSASAAAKRVVLLTVVPTLVVVAVVGAVAALAIRRAGAARRSSGAERPDLHSCEGR